MEAADVKLMIDTAFVLLSGVLVFFMNAGFALVETGLCRGKNAATVLTKNFIVAAMGVFGFWAIGYALMFGAGNDYVGTTGFFLAGEPGMHASGIPTAAFFFFQLCFAVTAATIVSGAVAERTKLASYMIFAVLLTAVIYPVVGHWIWGGGWLAKKGFADFAGSTVVHSIGGWAALVGAIVAGPRLGKYAKDGKVKPIPGHNLAMVTLGGLILWVGWYGFNAGSQLSADPMKIAHICLTTTLGAGFGAGIAAIWAWVRVGKPDLSLIVNGALAGLVGITAGCAFVEPWAAAVIGTACGVAVIEAVMFFDKVKVDDPVGATSVHLVCGVLGTLFVGVFGKAALGLANDGLVYGGGATQLWIQLQGVLATAVFVVAVSNVCWFVIKKTIGVRVSEDEEIAGLDVAEIGVEAYPVDRESASKIVSAAAEAAPEMQPALAPSKA